MFYCAQQEKISCCDMFIVGMTSRQYLLILASARHGLRQNKKQAHSSEAFVPERPLPWQAGPISAARQTSVALYSVAHSA
jgi:hypothetical protein